MVNPGLGACGAGRVINVHRLKYPILGKYQYSSGGVRSCMYLCVKLREIASGWDAGGNGPTKFGPIDAHKVCLSTRIVCHEYRAHTQR